MDTTSGHTRNRSPDPEEASRRSTRAKLTHAGASLVSTHPEPHPIDASLYTISYLRGQKTKNDQSRCNEDWFKRLDFVRCDDYVIRVLFVTKWHIDRVRGNDVGDVILPPPSHRRNKAKIAEFLRMGTWQQKEIIKQWENCIIEATFDSDKKAEDSPSGFDEKDNVEEGKMCDDKEEEVKCRGFTLDDIRESRLNDKDSVEEGFIHVCREAIISRTKLSMPGNHKYKWSIANAEAFQTGVITSGTGDGEHVVWTLEEVKEAKGSFDGASIRDLECKLEPALKGKKQCLHCHSIRRSLFRRCRERVQIREKPLSKHTNIGFVNRVENLQEERNRDLRQRLIAAQKQNREMSILLQRQKDTGVEVDAKEAAITTTTDEELLAPMHNVPKGTGTEKKS